MKIKTKKRTKPQNLNPGKNCSVEKKMIWAEHAQFLSTQCSQTGAGK